MRKLTLLLFIGIIAMIMLGATEAATLKSKVASKAKVQAKSKVQGSNQQRAALAAAKANLASYGSVSDAKASCAAAVQ